MLCHRRVIGPRDRTGLTALTALECCLDTRAHERTDKSLGRFSIRVAKQREGTVHKSHRIVRRESQRCVVPTTRLFRNPHRFGTKFDNQRLGYRAHSLRRRHPESSSRESLEIHGGSRQGKGRMDSKRDRPHVGGALENSKAVAAGGVHNELPRTHRAGFHEFLHHTRQIRIGNSNEDEISVGSNR